MEHIWMFHIFISSIFNTCQYLFPLSPLPRHCIILQLLKFASASQFHFLYKPFCSIFLLLSIFVWFSLPPPTPDTVLFWNFLNLHLPHSWQANLGPHPARQTYHLCQIEFAPSFLLLLLLLAERNKRLNRGEYFVCDKISNDIGPMLLKFNKF